MSRLKGILALLFVLLHGFSFVEPSEALVSHTRNDGRTRLPSSHRPLQTIHPEHQKIYQIRGGALTIKRSPTSLDGLPRGSVAIANGIAPVGILGSINSFFKHHPFLASFLICAIKASSADAITQFASRRKTEEQSPNPNVQPNNDSKVSESSPRNPFCFKRNLALLFYGGLYQGCGQEFIYNSFFSWLFGTGTNIACVMKKVSMDMLVMQPILSLPIAYLIKAPIFGQTVRQAMSNYVRDLRHKQLLQQCWKVWIPAETVIFTLVPTHLRISSIACVSFFWIMMFSSISSSSSTTEEEAKNTTATAAADNNARRKLGTIGSR